jgi:hydrogenase nickel incorporation protein HypB
MDLLPHLTFDLPGFRRSLEELNPKARLMELSCTTGEGFDQWIEWLEQGLKKERA